MRILTDKLCLYLKVQTVSERQVLGNAVFKRFTDESAALRPAESSAARCSEQTPREAALRRESDLALAGQ